MSKAKFAVFKNEVKRRRASLTLWALGIILIGLFYALIYPSIGANQQFGQALNSAPDLFKSFIGSSSFFSTPDGFIHAEFFSFDMPFILGFLAIIIGASLLAKEESAGTMELLLARPISRGRIFSQKLLGLAASVAILTVCTWLGLWLGSLIVPKFDITLGNMALAILNLGLMSFTFGCLALLITGVKSSRGLATGIISAYFIVSYVVGTFGAQVSWLKHFQFLALFHYFDSKGTLLHHTDWSNFLILIVICAVACALAALAFRRRDIS